MFQMRRKRLYAMGCCGSSVSETPMWVGIVAMVDSVRIFGTYFVHEYYSVAMEIFLGMNPYCHSVHSFLGIL
jgi:hypothetical protein